MDIYIAKDGQPIGPYRPNEIQARLEDSTFDGTELAWQEGQEAWVNVKELLEGADAPALEPEETLVEPESTQAPEPLDEETLGQINKIKELISDGHADTAWQLVRSLNNPRIYEGLLEDCPVDDEGWVRTPKYLRRNGDLFIKLLVHIPQEANVDAELKSVTKLHLSYTQISDVTPLKDLTQLTKLDLNGNQISDVTPLKELTQLTELWLNQNQISDVTPLKDLTQLTELNLWGNEISDVTPLKDLTQLTTLELYGNQISESDIEDLQEALPECEIN